MTKEDLITILKEFKNVHFVIMETRTPKRIYISLPITGHDIEKVRLRAKKYADILKSIGWNPVTPFDVCPELDKQYSYYMGKDIEALLECDAIYMTSGWGNSKGCRAELAVAQVYNKEIITDPLML